MAVLPYCFRNLCWFLEHPPPHHVLAGTVLAGWLERQVPWKRPLLTYLFRVEQVSGVELRSLSLQPLLSSELWPLTEGSCHPGLLMIEKYTKVESSTY